MSAFVLTSSTVWADGLELTNNASEISIKTSVDEQEVTTFGSGGYRARIGGLKTVEADVKGIWEIATDATAWTGLGVADQVMTFTSNGTAAEPAWFFQGSNFTVERFGKIGEVDPFGLSIMSTNAQGLISGQLTKAKGNVSATGALGSVVNLGAPTSTQYVYAVLHVFTAATTITVQVQSDDNSGMTSATTRGTIGPVTTTGGTWMTRVAGPFAGETYWRMNVSAITGTFNVAGAIGIA